MVYNNLGSEFKPFSVLNLGVAYKVTKDVTLNGAVNNLLDKDFTRTHILLWGTAPLLRVITSPRLKALPVMLYLAVITGYP